MHLYAEDLDGLKLKYIIKNPKTSGLKWIQDTYVLIKYSNNIKDVFKYID